MNQHPLEALSREMRLKIEQLFIQQGLGVLSTTGKDGHPYASLIAFVPDDENSILYFVTPKATRKYGNLMDNRRVALLVNNCVNSPADFHEAIAVTVLGNAHELDDPHYQAALPVYLDKHPYLRQFAQSPSCAMFAIEISGFTMVQQFQNVSELRLDHALDPDT